MNHMCIHINPLLYKPVGGYIMSKVVHFEINAPDADKAATFYGGVFGWEFQQWGDGEMSYWLIKTGADDAPGIGGGMMSTPDWPQTVAIIEVDSVDTFTEKINESGGELVVGKMAIKGIGYAAYFKDPNGMVFGIYQPDPSAA